MVRKYRCLMCGRAVTIDDLKRIYELEAWDVAGCGRGKIRNTPVLLTIFENGLIREVVLSKTESIMKYLKMFSIPCFRVSELVKPKVYEQIPKFVVSEFVMPKEVSVNG